MSDKHWDATLNNQHLAPKVYNKRGLQFQNPNTVYIGRPSKWGNPFEIGKHGTREEVIAQYEKYVATTPGMVEMIKRELRGKSLICWCKPHACHGDVLLRIANEEESNV